MVEDHFLAWAQLVDAGAEMFRAGALSDPGGLETVAGRLG
jgi:hypothetical protein